jgi:hypothetical protein
MIKRVTLFVAVSVLLTTCAAPRSELPPPQLSSGRLLPAMSEEEVRQDLADRGYGEVYDLRPQPDGSWIGSAMLGDKQRQVTIGSDGSVTAQ